ncbi:hypothetical protein ACP70R_000956 [Stipagrostis hirtigluma subsp. patula]
MEKKDPLGVRKKAAAAAARRTRRKVAAPASRSAGALVKAIAEYLASDSYMYAPLVSAPSPSPPPSPAAAAPSAAPPSTPEKEVTLVQKYRGSWRATFTSC